MFKKKLKAIYDICMCIIYVICMLSNGIILIGSSETIDKIYYLLWFVFCIWRLDEILKEEKEK